MVTYSVILMIFYGLIPPLCSNTKHNVLPIIQPSWSVAPMSIDLSAYPGEGEYISRFSQDSNYIGITWWATRTESSDIGSPLRVVFNMKGEEIKEAVEKGGLLTPKYSKILPDLIPRSFGRLSYSEIIKSGMQSSSFLKEARGWAFDDNFAKGARILLPGIPMSEFPADIGGKRYTLEMWQLFPVSSRLWSLELPDPFASIYMVELFSAANQDFVFVGESHRGYIISYDNKPELLQFAYSQSIPKHLSSESIDKDKQGFCANAFSLDRIGLRLACGDSLSRRIAIFSIPHEKLVCELNASEQFSFPKGGYWEVSELQFVGGKYLIAEYLFAGRGTKVQFEPTDIIDTKTWEKVWTENSQEISSVQISPDGKKLAFIRHLSDRQILEIGPFQPNLSNN